LNASKQWRRGFYHQQLDPDSIDNSSVIAKLRRLPRSDGHAGDHRAIHATETCCHTIAGSAKSPEQKSSWPRLLWKCSRSSDASDRMTASSEMMKAADAMPKAADMQQPAPQNEHPQAHAAKESTDGRD